MFLMLMKKEKKNKQANRTNPKYELGRVYATIF